MREQGMEHGSPMSSAQAIGYGPHCHHGWKTVDHGFQYAPEIAHCHVGVRFYPQMRYCTTESPEFKCQGLDLLEKLCIELLLNSWLKLNRRQTSKRLALDVWDLALVFKCAHAMSSAVGSTLCNWSLSEKKQFTKQRGGDTCKLNFCLTSSEVLQGKG